MNRSKVLQNHTVNFLIHVLLFQLSARFFLPVNPLVFNFYNISELEPFLQALRRYISLGLKTSFHTKCSRTYVCLILASEWGKGGGGELCLFRCLLFHNVCLRFQSTPGESRPASHGGHLTRTGEALIPEVKVDRMTNMNRKWNTMTGT